jgi:hypothetical protein
LVRPDGFPDFFIVGAPRCGTTTLSRYLRKHPRICFSRPKEPHFFSDLSPFASTGDLWKDYIEPFFHYYDPDVHRAVGEGSVSYLYALPGLQRILQINPEARFIIQVRDPMEMLRSYHARMLFTLEEDQPDFAKAWAAQGARARGEGIPRYCRQALLLQYAEAGQLGKYVAQLFDLAGRDRCHVIVFDDLREDPSKVYAGVLDFLGVEHDGRRKFLSKQVSKTFRHLWLHRLLYRPSPGFVKLVLAAERRHRAERQTRKPWIKRMRSRLTDWNTVKSRPAPLSPEMRSTIRETLSEDVEKLGKLLDRDLGHWLQAEA